MPGPLAPLIGFSLGVVFAWAASEELHRSAAAAIGSRALVVIALFAGLVFAPVAAYFLAFETDWAFAYVIDARRLPSAVHLALALCDVASVPVGFVLAAPRARARKLLPLLLLGLLPSLLVLGCVVAAAPRLATQATYAQFHGNFGTRSVAGSPLGYALLWMNGVLVLGVAWTLRELRVLAPRPPQSTRRLLGGSASPSEPPPSRPAGSRLLERA
jgi:hypothetical protein